MKEKKTFDVVTNVPDKLAVGARVTKLKRSSYHWKIWTAIVACVAVVIGIVSIFMHINNNSSGALLDVVFPKAYAFNAYDTQREVINANPVSDDFIIAVNAFSYKTASQILVEGGNINYSPLSLYYALALAASGANGETADELLSVLGVADQTFLSQQCGNLYRRLYTDNEIGKLKIANSLWMSNNTEWNIGWKDSFIKNAAENFYAHSFSVDFSNNKTGQSMAKWISDNTNGTLKPNVEINQEQILSILNTVYFYDEWIDKFDKAKTAADIFYLSDYTTVNCDFMNRTYGSHYFTIGDGFTRSGLSLKNAGRMIFILPDEGVSPRELLSTPEKMRDVFEGGEDGHGEVVWQIPKFNFGSKFDLVDTLKSLGVNSTFEQAADFSYITDHMAFITSICQETHIAIDENGVEASAFTQIDYAGAAPPQDRADMILNRPFIYGITASDGTLLFVGICENPIAK